MSGNPTCHAGSTDSAPNRERLVAEFWWCSSPFEGTALPHRRGYRGQNYIRIRKSEESPPAPAHTLPSWYPGRPDFIGNQRARRPSGTRRHNRVLLRWHEPTSLSSSLVASTFPFLENTMRA